MTTDKNNFQFRNDGSKEAIEAYTILSDRNKGLNEYYGKSKGKTFAAHVVNPSIPEIIPSEALALLRDTPATITMLQELEEIDYRDALRRFGIHKNSCDKAWSMNKKPCTCGLDKLINEPAKHTAPQPNWDAIDDLVKVYANDTATSDKHYDGILNYWRKLIGYTLDANGKPVAIQKGGEDGSNAQ